MGNFFIGLLIIFAGFMMTWKANWIVENFGTDEWAENKLSGGTRSMYRFIGIIIIFFGTLIATGLLKNFLKTIFGSVFKS